MILGIPDGESLMKWVDSGLLIFPRVQASWSKEISGNNSDPLDFIIHACWRVLSAEACSHRQGSCGSFVSIARTPLILFAKGVCDYYPAFCFHSLDSIGFLKMETFLQYISLPQHVTYTCCISRQN